MCNYFLMGRKIICDQRLLIGIRDDGDKVVQHATIIAGAGLMLFLMVCILMITTMIMLFLNRKNEAGDIIMVMMRHHRMRQQNNVGTEYE